MNTMARLIAGLIVLFSLLCVELYYIVLLLAMNISYVGSSVAVPTGRVYSILSLYDITTDRPYISERTLRTWTDRSSCADLSGACIL